MNALDESTIELAALEWFAELGYATAHGPDLAPEGSSAERESFSDVLLLARLQATLTQLNPDIPSEGIDEAFRMVTRMDGPTQMLRMRPLRQPGARHMGVRTIATIPDMMLYPVNRRRR